MNLEATRPYRKHLTSRGMIYMGGEEQEIVVKDLSLTGVLVELKSELAHKDAKEIFKILSETTVIDLYLPEIRLAGEAEIARVDMNEDHLLLALEFKNIAYDVDTQLYKRKFYRKRMNETGRILLNGEYREFDTINVSVEGMMISLSGGIDVKRGDVMVFEFEKLGLDGEIKVIWVERADNGDTLLGLEYVNMKKDEIKGIPRFAR